MNMRQRIPYEIWMWVLCFFSLSSSQGKSAQDTSILSLIKHEGGFLHWQTTWQELQPTFDLDNFQLLGRHDFHQSVLRSFPTFDMTKIEYPAMTAFSPDGLMAVAYGYAQTCGDDYCSVFLYDLRHHQVLELSEVGSNYPPFNGFAWLSNDLLVMIGEAYHFTKETVIDSVAPSVSLFDFHVMSVRVLGGRFVPKDEYLKNPDGHVTVEPDLILDYKR
jgi:hypothetical protein